MRIGPLRQVVAGPAVEVEGVAADEHHAVDGRGAAQCPAARAVHPAPVHVGLRIGVVVPVVAVVVQRVVQRGGNARHERPLRAARFEHQHAGRRRFAQARGDHAAGGAGADDDVVVAFLHGLRPWSSRPGGARSGAAHAVAPPPALPLGFPPRAGVAGQRVDHVPAPASKAIRRGRGGSLQSTGPACGRWPQREKRELWRRDGCPRRQNSRAGCPPPRAREEIRSVRRTGRETARLRVPVHSSFVATIESFIMGMTASRPGRHLHRWGGSRSPLSRKERRVRVIVGLTLLPVGMRRC